MLESLIQILEKVEYKLMKIKTDGSLSGYYLPQERCRSLTNVANILGSLVNKTTHNKNYEDDIALCQNKTHIIGNEPIFPNLINSEEFFKEVQNVLKSMSPSKNEIHTYLSDFQELLGDIIFSICEINNCQMKLSSGIKVKDLMTMKNLYSSIWELLSSMFYPNSFTPCNSNNLQRKPTRGNSSHVNLNTSDLINAVQSCLKEMVKVKLEIEHYIKFNLIEMRFNEPEHETNLKSNVTEDKIKRTNPIEYLNPQDYKLINNEMKRQSRDDVFSREFQEQGSRQRPNLYTMPPTQVTSQEDFYNPYMFPTNTGEWDNFDCKFVEDVCSNIFSAPMVYPSELLFFEPSPMVFKSQLEPTLKHSLPRIYSVDSVNDIPTIENHGMITNSYHTIEKTKEQSIPPINYKNKKENVINKSLFENTDGDLFNESLDNKGNKVENNHLKDKISSLFNMLRTSNETDDKGDIFDMNPLKVAKEDLSCFQLPKLKKTEIKIKKKKCLKDKHLNRNIKSHLQNEKMERPKPEIQRNKSKKSLIQTTSRKEKYRDLLKQDRFSMEYPMEFWTRNQNEVIFDEKSVIQLFKTDKRKLFNTESAPTEDSNFCLWPVAAKYIYVSKGQGAKNCHSVSSSNSISLAKSFEKSFFSLHMNKKYEQNRLYDGDLIVLDHTKTLKNKRDLNYSLNNPSNIVYSGDETSQSNVMKHLYSHNCDVTANNRNGQMIYLNNPLVPVEHEALRAKKNTFAVHYADCEDSFMVNKNYKKEEIDFFNFNSYDDTQNWDSFISIVASKVGPNTHINQQRMFRKIVKNLREDNVFANVQTLTSNGGPFRLFDINGYPLTDSSGKVLKDPYGKCVVELDNTGFPKDDVKVFDAAGKSPKDINFDPTQKPQTNCIVVKLTDNFKKSLHLFDKYGRPLTDANGKLLVNIHGRPLLRFDNFGRPNTDYRGGPLYTDNGLRWSYKTGQSFSKEQLSNESLTSKKFNSHSGSTDDTSISPHQSFKSEKNDPELLKQDNYACMDSRSSDIWLQVESVLQCHSKKIKVEEQHSQTNLIVNSVTIKQDQQVKECLSSIIYHDERVKECMHQYSGNQFQKAERTMEHENLKIKGDTSKGYKFCLEDKINCRAKSDILNSNINASIPLSFYNDILIKSTRSSNFADIQFSQKQPICNIPNIFTEKICKPHHLLVQQDILTKNRFNDVSMHYPNSVAKNIITLKNREYLNNLCNQILKNKAESRGKFKIFDTTQLELKSVFSDKKGNFTDTTLSDFTSSIVSKYTNNVPLYTDSPAASVESQKRDPQITKILEDIDSRFKKHDELRNSFNKRRDLKDQSFILDTSEKNAYKSGIQKGGKNQDRFEQNPRKIVESSRTSEETTTFVDIVNNDKSQYQINAKERIRAGLQSRDDHFIYTDSNGISNDTDYPMKNTNMIKQNKNIPENHNFSQPIKHTTGLYHGEYCRHFKNENEKSKDSPFRFPLDEQVETTIAMNYVDEKNWLGQDQNRISRSWSPKKEKKPGRNYRDCNLVSFLGTPVKYVWNKLDTRLSKQQGKEKKQKHFKTMYEPYEDEKKVKTLYHSSKSNKKDITSTETEATNAEVKRRQKYKQKGQICSFKSKSYSEIQDSKIGNMSYSGSQDTSEKYSPESSYYYNKCSSDTVVMSNHKHANPQRRNRKHEVKKQKHEHYSFETHHVHKNRTTNHHHGTREKSPKEYKKHSSKSPRSRGQTLKLIKKTEHSSKKKRVR